MSSYPPASDSDRASSSDVTPDPSADPGSSAQADASAELASSAGPASPPEDVARPPRYQSSSDNGSSDNVPSPVAVRYVRRRDGSDRGIPKQEEVSDEKEALGAEESPEGEGSVESKGPVASKRSAELGKNGAEENDSERGEEDSPTISGPGVLALKDMGESPPRDTCANCEAPLVGPYCSQCGQRAADRIVPLHEMTQEWIEDLFEFDIRIFRTLPTFFFKPGRLTKEYVQGRRVRYVRPLRLYLVASFILFTVLAFSDVATIEGLDGSSDAPPPADLIVTSDTEDEVDQTFTDDEISEAKRRASSQKNVSMTVGASGTEASSSQTVDPEKLRRELRAIDSLGNADPAIIDSIVNAHVGTATETFASAGGQRSDGQRSSGAEPSSDTSDSDAGVRAGDGSFASVEQRRKMAEEVTKDMSIKVPFIQDEDQKRQAEQYVKHRIAQTIIDPNGFIRGMIDRAPYVMFLLLPLFAFLLKLLYIRRGKLYIQHLIFALHIHAFIFLTFALSTGLLISNVPSLQTTGGWLTLAPFIYVYIAMQHVYEQGWIKTGIKMLVLFTLYNTVLTFGILILAIASLLLM